MIAVITGDIVASGNVEDQERSALLQRLQRGIREIDTRLGNKTFIANQIFRGDSFQIAQNSPNRALVEALGLYLAMQLPLLGEGPHVEIRMGIGIGAHSRPGDQEDLGWWSGEAFEKAADALDSLRSDRIALRTPWPALDEEFAVSLPLLSALMRMTWRV